MKSWLSAIGLAVLVLWGCDGKSRVTDTGNPAQGKGAGNSKAERPIQPEGVGSFKVAVSIPAEAAAQVARIEYTVSGADMQPLTGEGTLGSDNVVRLTIKGVKAGTARTVELAAYDSSGALTYSGSATVDVAVGETVRVSIVLRLPLTGKIAFRSSRDDARNGDIFVMDADGNNPINLTGSVDLRIGDRGVEMSRDGTRIAFTVDMGDLKHDIFSINVDGTGLMNVTNDASSDCSDPSWSPDASRILYSRGGGISAINADGTNLSEVIEPRQFDTEIYSAAVGEPSWSPDGTKIAFVVFISPFDIYISNADGTNPVNITGGLEGDKRDPSWSPDGTRIAFTHSTSSEEIYIIDVDGGNPVRLTDNSIIDREPSWSPDGTKIAFTSWEFGLPDIAIMNLDGSKRINLTSNGSVWDHMPSWSR